MAMPLPKFEEGKSSIDPWIYRDETGETKRRDLLLVGVQGRERLTKLIHL